MINQRNVCLLHVCMHARQLYLSSLLTLSHLLLIAINNMGAICCNIYLYDYHAYQLYM
ncbi:hypothetical protein RchiOBHm_Chr1g0318121 [Rosa chinensis]|uniref:Uncharacterized protein n=1 Tax=Rosa chinensis TaxID=74649 RepID=A0A2P6S817_ROSCH|nr:hypothetical protein RchiOBHm_Chr1g0318121 [Rosa chinensis]